MANNSWKLERSEAGPDLGLFQTRFDWMRNPRNGAQLKAVILQTPGWVNVVALTPEQKILVVHQYRFGIGEMTVEIPAGLIEPGETPRQAAERELLEETGYTAGQWEYLGWVEANPAFLNNLCHLWLARQVTYTHLPQQDDSEDVRVKEYSLDELFQAIQAGRMRNAFTLLALSQVYDLRHSLGAISTGAGGA